MKKFAEIGEWRPQRNPLVHAKPITGLWMRSGESHLALADGEPGNAILPNGVWLTANLEIGVPGLET